MEQKIDEILNQFAVGVHRSRPGEDESPNFDNAKLALLSLIDEAVREAKLNLLKEIRRSYPKKQTLQGRVTSRLTLADIDRMIGNAKGGVQIER